MARKKIVFFHHVSGIGGGSWCLLELVRALDRAIYEIVVVLCEHGPLEDELAKIDVQCYHISRFQRISAMYHQNFPFFSLGFFNELFHFVPAVVEIRKILRKIAPDLVYLNTSTQLLFALAARCAGSAPVVMHIREHWECRDLSVRGWIKNQIVNKCIDQLLAITQTDADCFGFPEQTKIVHDWVEFDTRDEEVDVREELDLDEADQIFLVPGGCLPIKGTIVAIKAFMSIQRDDVALVVLGMRDRRMTGWRRRLYYTALRPLGILNHREELMHYIRSIKHSKIKYCQPVKEIKSYMEASVAVISPFVVPHAAKAALEAGWLGKVAIVSDNGEGREYVLNGETGWIVPPGDVMALFSAMQKVAGDLALTSQMGRNAEVYVKKSFVKDESLRVVSLVIDGLVV